MCAIKPFPPALDLASWLAAFAEFSYGVTGESPAGSATVPAARQRRQSNHSSAGSNFGWQKIRTVMCPTALWRTPGGIKTQFPC